MGGCDSGKNPPKRIIKRNGHLSAQQCDLGSVAAFKQMPSFLPDHFKTARPLLEHCCICMPRRKTEWTNPDIRELGMRNILDCRSELSCNSKWLSYLFPLETYTFNKPTFKQYSDISERVIASLRVQEAIKQTARQIVQSSENEDENKVMKELKAVTQKAVKKMNASVSSVFIKIAAWFLTRFLRNLQSGIHVSESQMAMLKNFSNRKVPLIYLPLHRSHLDYILVTLTLWNFDIRAPYVAAGENLDIPFFNSLMRGLGGFFIRRRLDNNKGQRDILYRAILCQYMTEIMKDNEAIEFFIEGGRTRTGRAIIPKGGLLSIIVDAFDKGDIADAYIVPASFGYEKIMDGDFCREQMGLPKINESFFGAVKAILRVLFGSYGNIRVDFSQPFSLKEFLMSAKENLHLSVDYSPEERPPVLGRHMSFPLLEYSLPHSADVVDHALNSRLLVKTLADHTVYIADHCSSPMATHLLAFLLLTKYRQGVGLSELIKGLQWIVKELHAMHVDVGFCGQSLSVTVHAQRLLGDSLVYRTRSSQFSETRYHPNLSIPGVFELNYYSNFVTTHYALESILACALMYQSNLSLHQLTTLSPLPETTVTRESVLEAAQDLCLLLHTEFIFVPPCTSLENTLSQILDSFVSKEILHDNLEEDHGMNDKERQMANRIARSLEIDDGEDQSSDYASSQTYQVNVDHSNVRERLHFLVQVLGPILESLQTTISFVSNKVFREKSDKEFFQELGDFARSRVHDDLSLFSESCAMLNLKSAVKSLQDLHLLYCYSAAGMTLIGVEESAEAKFRLEEYASLLAGVLS